MNRLGLLLLVLAPATVPVFAATTPLPDSLLGNHYISFPSGDSFPSQNLIGPFPAGYGGAFQGNVYSNPTSATGTPTLTTVWCVDYQLDVEIGSAYSANITQLSAITTPTDNSVRYGNQTDKWDNSVTDPSNGSVNTNTAAYRYALAAALVSQYDSSTTDSTTHVDASFDPSLVPTNPTDSARNQAIQTAIWYVTYNSDYGATTWPPFGSTPAQQADVQFWVNYAEQNVNSVNLNDWAVISGPVAGTPAVLTSPNGVYQTFLVQVADLGPVDTLNSVAPEPTFYWMVALGLAALFLSARIRNARAGQQA